MGVCMPEIVQKREGETTSSDLNLLGERSLEDYEYIGGALAGVRGECRHHLPKGARQEHSVSEYIPGLTCVSATCGRATCGRAT